MVALSQDYQLIVIMEQSSIYIMLCREREKFLFPCNTNKSLINKVSKYIRVEHRLKQLTTTDCFFDNVFSLFHFSQYWPNETREKHKNKLMKKNYCFVFTKLVSTKHYCNYITLYG